ncbi:MAG: hypothetical protein JWP91_1719 [Fibrobacteres bacterium]|nr:hypothetical protein [Fibrobacterota bacterium]
MTMRWPKLSMRPGLAFLALLVGACVFDAERYQVQDNPPERIGRRVYRGSLEGRQGVLFFAASDTALTVAYDTVLCGLVAAWKGPVVGFALGADGSSYPPQGPLYHRLPGAVPRVWTVRNGQDTLDARARFIGFAEDSTGYALFRYALDLPGGKSILVDEEPSWDDHYGDNALQRDFRFRGLDAGMTVDLRLGGEPGRWKELWGPPSAGILTGPAGRETLEMSEDGVCNVKVTWEGSAGH